MAASATYIAILDRNIGILQWLGEAESHEAALAAFDAEVGIAPDGEPSLDDWRFYDVTADQAAEIQAWHDKGAPADEAPEWLG